MIEPVFEEPEDLVNEYIALKNAQARYNEQLVICVIIAGAINCGIVYILFLSGAHGLWFTIASLLNGFCIGSTVSYYGYMLPEGR